jgi:hypothetical protein
MMTRREFDKALADYHAAAERLIAARTLEERRAAKAAVTAAANRVIGETPEPPPGS